MKTSPKKKEMSLRLRESRREEKSDISQQQQPDPSKKLEPEVKTEAAGAASTSSGSGAGTSGARVKGRRSLYKKGASQKGADESHLIRLFTRSLDLSKYEEKTPLYPICRAWMANQPRNPAVAAFNTDGSLKVQKRVDNGEEILEGLRSGEIKVLTQLPAAKRTDLPIIPPRLEFGEEDKSLQGASHSELLAANLKRWKKVRSHWVKHEKKYQNERYAIVDQIMAEVCKSNIAPP